MSSCAKENVEIPTEQPLETPKPYSEYNEMLEQLDMTKMIATEGMTVEGFEKESLQALESASEIIVLATVMHKEQVDNTPEELVGTGIVVDTTLATLKIEKVFKGEELLDGSGELVIEEICYVEEYNDGTSALATFGLYYPAKEYETYMFFLKELEGGKAEYTPTSRWYGKYPAEVATTVSEEEHVLTYRDLELASKNMEQEAPENMQDFYAEVCEKYLSGDDVVITEASSEYNKLLKEPIPKTRRKKAGVFYDFLDNDYRDCDIIVLATVTKKEQYAGGTEKLYENTEYDGDWLLKGTTLATLKILKVFQGEELLDGADELQIQELCYLWEDDSTGEVWISSVAGYYPTKEYTTYLFFLKELENGAAKYMPNGATGKFPITKTAKTVYEKLGLRTTQSDEQQGEYDSSAQTACQVDTDGLLLEQQGEEINGMEFITDVLCKEYFTDPAVIAAFEDAPY